MPFIRLRRRVCNSMPEQADGIAVMEARLCRIARIARKADAKVLWDPAIA